MSVAAHRRRRLMPFVFGSMLACLMLVVTSVGIVPAVAAAPIAAAPQTAKPGETAKKPGGKPYKPATVKQPPTEVVGKRTAYSDTYDNHDGTFTESIGSSPINYRPTAGAPFEPIDLSFAAVSGGKGRVRAGHTTMPVEVGAADASGGFMSIDTGKGVLRLALAPGMAPGKSGKIPGTKESLASLEGVMPGVDLEVSVDAAGARTFFIFGSKPASNSFALELKTGSLKAVLQADGSIAFVDAKGQTAAIMPRPYAVDSTVNDRLGSGLMTDAVRYSLSSQGSKTLLTVTVDEAWLSGATYPVYVDPTFTNEGYISDNFVSSKYPDYNYSNYQRPDSPYYHELWLGMDPTNSANVNYDYIRFPDLSALAGVTIDTATLQVTPYHQYYNPPTATTTWVDRVTGNWSRLGLTWNNKPASTPITSTGLVENQTGSFNITETVRGWVDGTYLNYGVKLHENGNGGTYWKRLISSEQGGECIPKLVVTYNLPVATPSAPAGNDWTNNRQLAWDYTDVAGTPQSAYKVTLDNNSDFSSPVVSTDWVTSANHNYAVSAGTALANGTTYYWKVQVKADTDVSHESAAATFRWDASIPGAPSFTAPVAGVFTAGTSYAFAWGSVPTDPSVAQYHVTRQSAPYSGTPGVCSGSWGDMDGGVVQTGTAYSISGMLNQTCYRVKLNSVDGAGNSSAYVYSAFVMRDAATPAAPTVTDNCGQVGSCYRLGNSIYFQPDAARTITLTATGTDTPSKIFSATFGSLSDPTGWTYTPGTVAENPASRSLTWSLASSDGPALAVTVTNQAGTASSASTLHFFRDPGATVAFSAPTPGATSAITANTQFFVVWLEGGGQSPITARSLQRQKVAANDDATCPAAGWSADGSPTTAQSPVTVAPSDIAPGYCYRWVQTLTDSLGAHSFPSFPVYVDATAPTATLVTPADGRPFSGNLVVTGIANDAYFSSYTLDYGAGTSPSSWTNIAASTIRIPTTGTLGIWVPGSLTGVYSIRLGVIDQAGNVSMVTRTVYLANTDRGSEDFYGSVPFDLGGGWNLGVNVASGEASLSRGLFSIPSYGPGQSLSLAYNSNDAATTGRLGKGWSSNLTQYLTFESGFVVWHRADGAIVPFGSVGGTWQALAGHYETLNATTGGYQITSTDGSSLSFDVLGALTAVTDRYGLALTLGWTSTSATATDAAGHQTTMALDGSGRLTTATDSAGRQWVFGYAGDKLHVLTDPQGRSTTLDYDASGRLASITRSRTPLGGASYQVAWAIDYYADGRVDHVADAIGGSNNAAAFTYDVAYASGTTRVVQPRDTTGATPAATTDFDLIDTGSQAGRGWIGQITRFATAPNAAAPVYWSTDYTYDDNGNVLSQVAQIDATHSATTTWTYQGWGDVATVTDPLGILTTNEYGTDGFHDLRVTTVTGHDPAHPLHSVTAYAYDAQHRLCREVANPTVSDPKTITCASSLDQSEPSDSNVVTAYAYDAHNQMISQTNPLGTITVYEYDAWGNQTSVTRNYVSGHGADNATNIATTYTYDGAGNVMTETAPLQLPTGQSAVKTYAYDGLGRGTSATDSGDSTTPAVRSVTTWDELGAKTSESQQVCEGSPSSCAWTELSKSVTAYDALGHILSQTSTTPATPTTDAIVLTTTYVPDLAGDIRATTDSDGSTTASTFDALGQPLSQSHDGAETSHAYDGLGRETQTVEVRVSDPSLTTTISYDADSNLLQRVVLDAVDNSSSQTTYAYDGLGRQTSVTDPTGSVTSKAYDQLGQATKSTVGGSDTDVAYDRVGNVVEISGPYDPSDPDAPKPATTKSYDNLGRVTSQTSNGTTTATYYDAADRVIASVDADGSVARTVYNVRGQITKTIDNCVDSGQSTPATCAGTGGSDAGTNVITINTYGADGASMVAQKLEAGIQSETTLDGSGRTLSTVVDVGGLALTTTYGYDSKGRQSSETDPAGHMTRTVYDTNGNVCRTISNAGTLNLASLTDPCTSEIEFKTGIVNVDTRYRYDNAGNKTDETAPDDGLNHFTYDGEGNLLTEVVNYVPSYSGTDLTVNATTTHVLADGREIGSINPAGVRAATVYDDDGHVCRTIENSTIDPSTLTNPCSDPIAGVTNYANVDTIYGYDPSGQKTRVVAPSPADDGTDPTSKVVTLYAYDLNERLCRVVENADPDLDLDTVTDQSGASDDCYGSLSTADSASVSTTISNVDTQYHYDDAGNLTSQVSVGAPSAGALAGTTQYGYDDLGHQTSQTDPDGHLTVWTYSARGDRATQTDPDGQRTYWFYDAAGRMCRRVAFATTGNPSFPTNPCSSTQPVAGAAVDTVYSFDADGNQTRALNALTGEWIDATYDALSRPANVTHSGGVANDPGTFYDNGVLGAVSRRDPSSNHGQQLDYVFTLDKASRQVVLVDPLHQSGAAYSWTYGATGAAASASDPTGNTTTFGHDSLGRLAGISTTGDSNGCVACSAYSYNYNSAGNAVGITSTVSGDSDNGTVAYSYDQLSRLLSYSPSAPTRHQTYAWNALPDRKSITVGTGGGAVTRNVSYDAASRPTSDPAHSSDANGRVTKTPGASPNEVLTLSYDPLGRLAKVSSSAGTTTCYAYDPLDRLESATSGTSADCSATPTTTFSYVGLTNALALDQTASSIRRHVTDLDGTELYVYVSDTNPIYLGRNAHGDVTWSYDASGAPAGHATYDPFGNTLGSATVPDGTRWQGSWCDTNTGLYYVVARWYDPASGRFLSQDPMEQAKTSPQDRDLYQYGAGDPVNRMDPDGRCSASNQEEAKKCQEESNRLTILDTSVAGRIIEPSGWNLICGSGAIRVVLAFAGKRRDWVSDPGPYSGYGTRQTKSTVRDKNVHVVTVYRSSKGTFPRQADQHGWNYMMYLALEVHVPGWNLSREGLQTFTSSVGVTAWPADVACVTNYEAGNAGCSGLFQKVGLEGKYAKTKSARLQFDEDVTNGVDLGVPVQVATHMCELPSQYLHKCVGGHYISVVGYDRVYYYYIDTCPELPYGCGSLPKKKIGGTWRSPDPPYVGSKDGFGDYSWRLANPNLKYTWRIERAKLWNATWDYIRNRGFRAVTPGGR
jgi:RHS repeat-associated protein